jgi:hypothetical protein
MPACRGRHETPALGRALRRGNDRTKLQRVTRSPHAYLARARSRSLTSSARANSVGGMLRPLEIDHQLKLGPLLDWQIGWFCSLQDFIDVRSREVPHIFKTDRVGEKASRLGHLRKSADKRETMSRRRGGLMIGAIHNDRGDTHKLVSNLGYLLSPQDGRSSSTSRSLPSMSSLYRQLPAVGALEAADLLRQRLSYEDGAARQIGDAALHP